MADSSIPIQDRTVDPFASYNSDTVNELTRMLTYGEDGLATTKSCDISLDSTSNTLVNLSTGILYKDDVRIEITTEHVVDFKDSNQYYDYNLGFDEDGYYYIVLDYTFVKSRPAPQAKILIVKPSQVTTPLPTSWLFLKAVKVEGAAPNKHVVSVHDSDPGTPANKRTYIKFYSGSEVSIPAHNSQRDTSRIVYSIEEDDFFFGLLDRWLSIGAAAGSSYAVSTVGFAKGDLVYVNAGGNLGLAIATATSLTADGIVRTVSVEGIIQTGGKVNNVQTESGSSVAVGTNIYLSDTETGKVTDQKSSPISQFVGKCIEVVDSTSINVLFHRGEPLVGPLSVVLSSGASWILDSTSGLYYQVIDISCFNSGDVVLEIYDIATDFKIEPSDIEFTSAVSVRIWMPDDTHQLNVTIIG